MTLIDVHTAGSTGSPGDFESNLRAAGGIIDDLDFGGSPAVASAGGGGHAGHGGRLGSHMGDDGGNDAGMLHERLVFTHV